MVVTIHDLTNVRDEYDVRRFGAGTLDLEYLQLKRYYKVMRGMKRVLAVASLGMVATLLSVTWLAQDASAAINQQINFQGKLTNTDGTNIANGNYSIRFRVYTDPTADALNACAANSCKWEETQATVSVTDGIFRVALGSVNNTLSSSVDFNGNALYLGVKVGSDSEMTPRIQFTAAPYAFNTEKLNGITSAGYVQLGQVTGATGQTDSSTNAGIYINKTGASGNIVQLQKAGADVFTIGNTGAVVSTTTIQGSSLNGTTGINTGAAGGTQRIDASGNLVSIGNITGTAAVSIQAGGASALSLANGTTGTAVNIGNTTSNPSIAFFGSGVFSTTTGAISLNGATTVTGTNTFTVNGGATSLTGPSAGSSTALAVTTGVASNVGIRINVTGAAANAFEVNTSGVGVTAAFSTGGDLTLGATGAAAGALLTPSTSTAATASSALVIATGDSTTSGATGAVTLQSGNATSGTAGTVSVDTGTSSTGTPELDLGATNARLITIGNTNAATTVANIVGTGTAAFSIQGASSAVYMRIDSSNNRLYVGNPTADTTAFVLVLDNKSTTGGDPAGVEGAMYYNTADNDFRAYQNNNWTTVQPVRYAYLSADRASTSTTYADVTDLSFSVSANTNYEMVCNIIYRTAATTTGIKFALNGPATPNSVMGQFIANSTATALNGRSFNAYNGTTATTGVQTANTDFYGIFRAYFRNGANAGTLQLRYGSEIGGSAATVRANSYCRLSEL